MNNNHETKGDFAKQFVDNLLEEGVKISCDEANGSFNSNYGCLPQYYDEEKYKRGQKFFHKNIFAMFLGKMLGLLSVLALPTVLRLLIYTKMSSTATTAYKRYLQTIYHMCIWYDNDIKPGSKLWQSIDEVRYRHNSASKKGCAAGLGRISQKDMALTQFGFMGYAIVKGPEIGIHNASREELEGLVHLWRVLGYVLGIDDRFNICRESLEETQEICKLLFQEVIRPEIEKKDPEFVSMANALMNGMWCMMPVLIPSTFLGYLYCVFLDVQDEKRMEKVKRYVHLNFAESMLFRSIISTTYFMKLAAVRVYLNLTMYLALWLMPRFPFLAYLYLGYNNSQFNILNNNIRKHG